MDPDRRVREPDQQAHQNATTDPIWTTEPQLRRTLPSNQPVQPWKAEKECLGNQDYVR